MLAGHGWTPVQARRVSLRALALAIALVLIVPGAVGIAVGVRRSARADGGASASTRGLELLYAAVPLGLLAALVALAWTAD